MPKKPAKGPAKAGPLPKKIKRPSDLPLWFTGAEYGHLANYDALEWSLLLAYLLALRADLQSGELIKRWRRQYADTVAEMNPTGEQIVDAALRLHLTTPVSEKLIKASYERAVKHPLRSLQFIGLQSIHAGHRVGIATTVDKEAIYGKSHATRMRARAQMMKDSTPFFVDLIPDTPSGYNFQRSSGVIAVDMWLPDDILIANFKRWLAAARSLRKQFAARRLFNQNDFARWVDDGFVPYSLLRMWATFRGVEISQPVFVEALFPNRRSVTVDQFRKTKIPNYEDWFSYATLELLEAQSEFEILDEIAEEKASQNIPDK